MLRILKKMFSEMVIRKNADLISTYYHPEFLLFTNGQEMDYASFHKSHVDIYKTDISYQIRYDEETLFESEDRLAARVWITTSLPGEKSKEIEVILIAQYQGGQDLSPLGAHLSRLVEVVRVREFLPLIAI